MAERFTIVGGRGFIGRALVATLRDSGADVASIAHRDPLPAAPLGHVVYASGVSASVAEDASYAYGAHVEGVRRILEGRAFSSLLYLSSTRVYDAAAGTHEDAPIAVAPANGRDLYRITKVAGEALCLANASPAVRVARLSNVAGENFDSPLFLSDVLRQAARGRCVAVRTTRASAKDYIAIGDVCRYLTAIARGGRARIYNVAAGTNVENGAIFDVLATRGVDVRIAPDATLAVAPPIDVRRLQAEFGPPRESLLDVLPHLLDRFTGHPATA